METHEIIVYDENGLELERTIEHISVSHMVRYKHVFGETYTTYSFNTYYNNGLMNMGLIPEPPFTNAKLL